MHPHPRRRTPRGHSGLGLFLQPTHTGVLVLRGGLKNGSGRTVAAARCLTASTVTSICSFVPGCACCGSTLANAINCFSNGDQVVDVALPACSRPLYTGTCTREAVAGV